MIKRNDITTKLAATVLCIVLCNVPAILQAQQKDSITVQLNKELFAKGDTINFEINLQQYASVAKTATIQLWIEDIKTGRRWKFRYPLVNGYINARLKIDSTLKDGRYAFNFLLQKTFFSITGHLVNATKDDKLLNYIMIARDKQTVVDFVSLNEQQSFVVKNMLFQDSAFFIFARPKQKNNQLMMNIATPLDSAFTASATVTKFIVVGNVKNDAAAISADTAGYIFKPDETKYKIMMPEVVVKTRSNKRLQDFDRENSTGVFSSSDAIMLDGISSDELENAPDLYTYLTVKVGGLRLVTDSETGNRSFSWRGEPTEIYINEIKLDPDIPLWINPSDIAMIKVFRPGTSLSSGAGNGGAIAIYTKTGEYSKTPGRNYSFFINGYTGLEAVWKQ